MCNLRLFANAQQLTGVETFNHWKPGHFYITNFDLTWLFFHLDAVKCHWINRLKGCRAKPFNFEVETPLSWPSILIRVQLMVAQHFPTMIPDFAFNFNDSIYFLCVTWYIWDRYGMSRFNSSMKQMQTVFDASWISKTLYYISITRILFR